MQIDYKVTDGKLFDLAGKEVLPDEKGIIYITIDGHPKRYILEKFLIWITKAKEIQPAEKRTVCRTRVRKLKSLNEKRPSGRPRINPVKITGERNEHKRKPIIAIHPDGKEEEFKSRIDAVRKLNLGRCCIWRVLDHPEHKAKGFRFKSVPEKQKTA